MRRLTLYKCILPKEVGFMLHLSGLYRYPLKSAMGEALRETALDTLGVQGDRRWMVVDTQTGALHTQRLLAQMTQLQARWLGSTHLQLSAPGMSDMQVAVPDEQAPLRTVTIWRMTACRCRMPVMQLRAWLSQWLGRACRLVQVSEPRARQVDTAYAEVGDKAAFADGFPLLLIGQASLDDLSARVGRPLPMLRFRPNLVVSGSAAYAEDSWKRIRIGELEFRVVKGCSRCIMTTSTHKTGERSADRNEPLTTLKTYRERDGEVFSGRT